MTSISITLLLWKLLDPPLEKEDDSFCTHLDWRILSLRKFYFIENIFVLQIQLVLGTRSRTLFSLSLSIIVDLRQTCTSTECTPLGILETTECGSVCLNFHPRLEGGDRYAVKSQFRNNIATCTQVLVFCLPLTDWFCIVWRAIQNFIIYLKTSPLSIKVCVSVFCYFNQSWNVPYTFHWSAVFV